jgi:hypothetical protein
VERHHKDVKQQKIEIEKRIEEAQRILAEKHTLETKEAQAEKILAAEKREESALQQKLLQREQEIKKHLALVEDKNKKIEMFEAA